MLYEMKLNKSRFDIGLIKTTIETFLINGNTLPKLSDGSGNGDDIINNKLLVEALKSAETNYITSSKIQEKNGFMIDPWESPYYITYDPEVKEIRIWSIHENSGAVIRLKANK
jgi:hypothetical protein